MLRNSCTEHVFLFLNNVAVKYRARKLMQHLSNTTAVKEDLQDI